MDSTAITGVEEALAAPAAPAEAESPGVPVDELLQRLHSGDLTPDRLSIEDRQRCVGQLTQEGFSSAEISQLMRLSERTIKRDRAALRRDEALKPGAGLGDELMGEFHRLTLAGVQRLTRLVQDRQVPAYARLWAEEAIIRIYQRFLDTTHKLNYIRDDPARLKHLLEMDPEEQKRYAYNRYKLFNRDPIPSSPPVFPSSSSALETPRGGR